MGLFIRQKTINKENCVWVRWVKEKKLHSTFILATLCILNDALERRQIVKFIYSEKATKFCKISTIDLSYVVTVKSMVEISQNFVAFSKYIWTLERMIYFSHEIAQFWNVLATLCASARSSVSFFYGFMRVKGQL